MEINYVKTAKVSPQQIFLCVGAELEDIERSGVSHRAAEAQDGLLVCVSGQREVCEDSLSLLVLDHHCSIRTNR